MEREMLRREGIKWHVADLSGHARLKPRRAPRAVTRRGPAHLIASPSHAVKSISRTVPARRRSPPFPAARPILRARSTRLVPFFTRVALAGGGPPPRDGEALELRRARGKVRRCPRSRRQGRREGKRLGAARRCCTVSAAAPPDVAELAHNAGRARGSASPRAGGPGLHVVRTGGGARGGGDVAAA